MMSLEQENDLSYGQWFRFYSVIKHLPFRLNIFLMENLTTHLKTKTLVSANQSAYSKTVFSFMLTLQRTTF